MKGGETPETEDIRPIAITGLMKKPIEKTIFFQNGEKIIKNINPEETEIHVSSVHKRLKAKHINTRQYYYSLTLKDLTDPEQNSLKWYLSQVYLKIVNHTNTSKQRNASWRDPVSFSLGQF